MDAMEKLRIYFDCSEGELFEYVPNDLKKPNKAKVTIFMEAKDFKCVARLGHIQGTEPNMRFGK